MKRSYVKYGTYYMISFGRWFITIARDRYDVKTTWIHEVLFRLGSNRKTVVEREDGIENR